MDEVKRSYATSATMLVPVYVYFHVLGMLLIAETCLAAVLTTTFAKDLTELDPPAQVQLVDQARVVPLKEFTVVH